MSDTARLEAELELSRASDALEAAREAMHEDRSNPDLIAAYQAESNTVAALRQAFRAQYSVEVGPGDAAPAVDTVEAALVVETPGVADE